MIIHEKPHPKAGQAVTIASGPLHGLQLRVEDWWDRINGMSLSESVEAGIPAAIAYVTVLVDYPTIPRDDEIVYGTVHGAGKLVHVQDI